VFGPGHPLLLKQDFIFRLYKNIKHLIEQIPTNYSNSVSRPANSRDKKENWQYLNI
jgi:hypothetical protein